MKMKDARMKNSSLLDLESSLFNASLHLPVKYSRCLYHKNKDENHLTKLFPFLLGDMIFCPDI